MSGLAGLVAGRFPAGVYRWHASFHAPDVQHTVEHAGWEFGYVDGWGTESAEEFHARIAAGLGFPDHYGANLDALWDCLTDLGEPTVLLWDGWGPLARADEPTFTKIVDVLGKRAATGPPFATLLRGDGPEVDVPSLD